MKLTKGQGISFFVCIIVFSIFSVFMFTLPMGKGIVFWLTYLFAVYSVLLMFGALFKLFKRQTEGEQFFNMPVVVAAWIYLAGQFYLSFKEVISILMPYTTVLVTNLVVAAAATALILILGVAGNRTQRNEQKIAKKVLFIKTLENELSMVECNDAELKKKVENLKEEITYSDPMSHSQLADIESSISEKVAELTDNIEDTSKALSLCDEIAKLIKKRNTQCVNLKGVKDEADIPQDTGKGNTTAIVGLGAAAFIILIALAIVFYFVPNGKYKAACKLMDEQKYDEAIAAFVDLGNFKDSPEKIEDIYDEILDNQYAAAVSLMEAGSYEEAVKAFESLNGYKDSQSKIQEIIAIAIEQLYTSAEQAFEEGDYETALGLYHEIAPYADSNEKIVDISNRLSADNVMYLGTYNGEPVAWRIVERYGFSKMLLIADQPIKNLPISDSITHTSFADSEIARWLNGAFISDFSESDLERIMPIMGSKVFILTDADVKRLTNMNADLKADTDWWLQSETGTGFKYATSDGTIEDAGDLHFREKGVRPAIWVYLK